MKNKKVFTLISSSISSPEHYPDVLVFSSEKRMNKHIKDITTKKEYKEFKENGEVTINEETRYFYMTPKIDKSK